MATGRSAVDIANDALTHLGRSRITSLDDSTEEARTMTQFIDGSIDAVLQDFPYNCARYLAQCSQLVATPAYGYNYQYQLPTDPYCLRVIHVKDQDAQYTWKRKGRAIHTDLTSCFIEYVGRTDAADLDALVQNVVASYLAYRAAYALTKSNSKANEMFELYTVDAERAQQSDGLEGSTRILTKSEIRTARMQSRVTGWVGATT